MVRPLAMRDASMSGKPIRGHCSVTEIVVMQRRLLEAHKNRCVIARQLRDVGQNLVWVQLAQDLLQIPWTVFSDRIAALDNIP